MTQMEAKYATHSAKGTQLGMLTNSKQCLICVEQKIN